MVTRRAHSVQPSAGSLRQTVSRGPQQGRAAALTPPRPPAARRSHPSDVAGSPTLVVAAQNAELVALEVGHHDPAAAVLGAAVLLDLRSQPHHSLDLFVARTVGGSQVEVQ